MVAMVVDLCIVVTFTGKNGFSLTTHLRAALVDLVFSGTSDLRTTERLRLLKTLSSFLH
ncbi:hypothetical protein Hanom_Chr15g01368511 [Helianthus anomalus]